MMKRNAICISLCASASMLASIAHAQTQIGPVQKNEAVTGDSSIADATAVASAEPTGGVADIIVTAERREASLQTVPIAVTALSQARLADGGVQVGSDLERFVPSLKMSPNITTPTNLSPALRGSLTQDASSIVAESAFGIYVDDVFVGRLNGNNTTLQDVERVEVLRGPQGTLYGRNTLAGAIKFVSRVPGEKTWLDATLGYGDYGQYLAAASVGGPLTSNGLAGSASFQFNGRNGYGHNVATGKRFGDEDNIAGRVKLHYTGIEKLDVIASASYTHSRNDSSVQVPFTDSAAAGQVGKISQITPTVGYYNVNVPAYPTGPSPIRSEPFGKTNQLIASLTTSYQLGDDAVLKSITGYVDTKDEFTTDFSGTGSIEGGNASRSRQFTQELQLQGTALASKLKYIGGLYYLHEKAHQDFAFFFLTPTSQTFEHNKTESIAGFGQASYEIVDNLKATAGIRYTQDVKDFAIAMNVLPTTIIPTAPQTPVSLHEKYHAWTPKFGLDYQVPTDGGFFDKLLIYGSAARGFRSGGFNGTPIFDLGISRTPYFPEKNWTYEGGVKADFLNRKVRVNANYFIDRISNLLLSASVNGGTSFPVQNAGAATIQGLEYEVNVVPFTDLNLFADGALLHGRFRSLNPTSAPAQAIVLYNIDRPKTPQTPNYTITVGGDYTIHFPIGGEDGAFRFGGDYYRTGSYVSGADNGLVIDAYDRINAFVALEYGKRIEAKLQVKNLENDHSLITGARSFGGFIALPPRTFFATLSYKM